MIRAELVRLKQCEPGDPCLEASEWRGLGSESHSKPLGACWKVILRHSGEILGEGGLLVLDGEDRVAEIYYRLEDEDVRRGLLVDSLRALVQLGFEELDLVKVRIWSLGEDRLFQKACREAGMELEEVLPKSRQLDGRWHDSYLFTAEKPESLF